MSNTSESELHELLIGLGQVDIKSEFIILHHYPFKPSIAYQHKILNAKEINDIDLKATPLTIRVGDELIFISINHKLELENFATTNQIQLIERPDIWSWILEPFLDTEYTENNHLQISNLLQKHGLKPEQITVLRNEVEDQMLKYNFDTMLWEWCSFDASDVLRAMRTKYNKEEFERFFKQVMNIALLS